MNQPKKNVNELRELINKVKYKDWDIVLRYNDDKPYIQIQFDAPDSFTKVVERQYCRKWTLSYYMTDSEVIRTAYKAVEAAVIHEMQEDFRFMEEPIFRPHYDVYKLLELSRSNAIDKRT